MPEENPRRKSSMLPVVIGAVVVIVLGAGGFFVWQMWGGSIAPAPPEEKAPPQPVVEATKTYASSTMQVSLTYPGDFTVDESYFYDQFKGKPIHGVKFTIPLSMATGTNLSSDTGITIEQLPRAKSCTGDIYLLANVKASRMTEASTTYSVATSSGAAAGNMYEELIYAVSSSSPCTAVRYFIHSTNIGNYEPGAVREYDRSALLQMFDKIRRSLQLQ